MPPIVCAVRPSPDLAERRSGEFQEEGPRAGPFRDLACDQRIRGRGCASPLRRIRDLAGKRERGPLQGSSRSKAKPRSPNKKSLRSSRYALPPRVPLECWRRPRGWAAASPTYCNCFPPMTQPPRRSESAAIVRRDARLQPGVERSAERLWVTWHARLKPGVRRGRPPVSAWIQAQPSRASRTSCRSS